MAKNGGSQPLASPDGAWIYYVRDGIFRIPAAGGREARIIAGPVGSFEVTDEAIFFDRGFGSFTKAEIHMLNLKSGTTRLIVTVERPKARGISVTPGGRSVLYSQSERESSDLILVDRISAL